MKEKSIIEGVEDDDVNVIEDPTYENLMRLSLKHSDAVIEGSNDLPEGIQNVIKESNKPNLKYQDPEKYIQEYSVFYDSVLNKAKAK